MLTDLDDFIALRLWLNMVVLVRLNVQPIFPNQNLAVGFITSKNNWVSVLIQRSSRHFAVDTDIGMDVYRHATGDDECSTSRPWCWIILSSQPRGVIKVSVPVDTQNQMAKILPELS